jgi:hypothetical protein
VTGWPTPANQLRIKNVVALNSSKNRKKSFFRGGTPPAVIKSQIVPPGSRRGSNMRPPPSRKAYYTTTTQTHMRPYPVFILLILYYTECKLFLVSKRIQIKNLSTTKFHNFLRSTTFVLGISPFEVVYKICISNFRDSNLVFC